MKKDGFFGESCSHAESCCSEIIKPNTQPERVRRAAAFTYDQYRRNALDDVKDRIDDLYEDFFMVPKVDDLSEFLKAINNRILEILKIISNLRGTSDEYGKKEETYYTWKDETENKIFELMERLSLQEINRTDIVSEAESFKTLIADLETLRGIEKELKGSSEINTNIKSKKITGLLRKIYKPNMFKPENDLKNNIWFSINLNDMEKFTKTKYQTMYLLLHRI